jgi:hypothetical protein
VKCIEPLPKFVGDTAHTTLTWKDRRQDSGLAIPCGLTYAGGRGAAAFRAAAYDHNGPSERASASAVAAPMPEVAPVTRLVLFIAN